MSSRIKPPAIYNRFRALLVIMFLCSATAMGQSLREKLNRQTEYHPHANAPDAQLVEVAKHFQIPMAIEWLDTDSGADRIPELNFKKGLVVDLIKAIVARAHHERLIVDEPIVRVFAPSAFNSPLNFLNLRIAEYCVSNASVFAADFSLRVAIDQMLYPKYFENGFSGGYGGGEKLFWIERISICLKRKPIRDLLTEVAAQSGVALWFAKLKTEELRGPKPFWKGVPINEFGTSAITGHWVFVALREDE